MMVKKCEHDTLSHSNTLEQEKLKYPVHIDAWKPVFEHLPTVSAITGQTRVQNQALNPTERAVWTFISPPQHRVDRRRGNAIRLYNPNCR